MSKLSTSNLPERNGISKTLEPGNTEAFILDITLDAPPYDAKQYNVNLHLVGPDLGSDFEGFLVDKNDPSGPRYKGQVARVRLSAFAFADAVTKTGRKINRDQSILQAFQGLADGLNLREEIDLVEADTIEEFVASAKKLFIDDSTLLNFCLAGKEYLNKEGYTNYDLFVAKNEWKAKKYSVVSMKDTAKLVTFDPAVHIVKKKATAPVAGFVPAAQNEFELN